ncbi:MAG: hypothetical protein IT429_04405 [Gemmataceae bacterium]|nr:hypothetical protein [Gemmataceae bacterium]
MTAEPTILVLDRAGNEAARYTTLAPEELQRLLPRLIRQAPPAGFPRPRPVEPELGVFTKRPPADTSKIPGFILRTLTDSCQVVPGSIRLAASAPGGLRLWIAKSMDGSIGYATTYGRFDGGGGIGCGANRYEADRQKKLRQVRGSGVVLWEGGQSKGRWFAALGLMDGWTEVRIAGQRIPVTTNGMITTGTGTRPRTATLSGPRGSRTFRFR